MTQESLTIMLEKQGWTVEDQRPMMSQHWGKRAISLQARKGTLCLSIQAGDVGHGIYSIPRGYSSLPYAAVEVALWSERQAYGSFGLTARKWIRLTPCDDVLACARLNQIEDLIEVCNLALDERGIPAYVLLPDLLCLVGDPDPVEDCDEDCNDLTCN